MVRASSSLSAARAFGFQAVELLDKCCRDGGWTRASARRLPNRPLPEPRPGCSARSLRRSARYSRRSDATSTPPRVVIIGTVPEEFTPDARDEPEGGGPDPGAAADPLDLAMMRRALGEAARAAELGEVPVGAVVARGEEVLAVAHNERETTKDPTAHAELLALRRAAYKLGVWRLTDCTLYSTLEPCPMCAGALHAARIGRLVYAAPDPKAGAAGTLYDLPRDTRLNHTYPCTVGILQSESAALLRAFFKRRRKEQHNLSDPLREGD